MGRVAVYEERPIVVSVELVAAWQVGRIMLVE